MGDVIFALGLTWVLILDFETDSPHFCLRHIQGDIEACGAPGSVDNYRTAISSPIVWERLLAGKILQLTLIDVYIDGLRQQFASQFTRLPTTAQLTAYSRLLPFHQWPLRSATF